MKASSAILLFLILFPKIAEAGDETSINQALQENAGNTYTLPAGTYTISSTITVPTGTTFQGTVGSNGELLSKIILSSTANLAAYEPIIDAHSNAKILSLFIDANSMDQKNVPYWHGHSGTGSPKQWGQGYDNMIRFQYGNDLEVAYCDFENGLGDGVRCINSENIDIHNNIARKLGHDAFFCIRSEGCRIHENYIQPRVNAAVRFNDVNGGRIYNNTIKYVREYDGISYDAGPDIQLEHDTKTMEDIEVCNNVLYEGYGPGIWLVGMSGTDEQLSVHHNLFLDCGSNHDIDWVGGIVFSGFGNTVFDHNCFDGSYIGAINFYSGGGSASNVFDSNIFTNGVPGAYARSGGYGIVSRSGSQSMTSVNNCYWNNVAGNTAGCSVSSSDIFIDPKKNPTPSGWRWVVDQWECDQVKPRDLGNYSTNDYAPISEDEIQKMNSIFDILNTKFSETATDGGNSYTPDIKKETKGKISAGVDIVGFRNMIEEDGKYYIKSLDDIIVVSEADNLASLPVSTDKEVSFLKNGNNITADLKVKIRYNTASTYQSKINGIPVIKIKYTEHSETEHFFASAETPTIYNISATPNVTVTILNNSYNPQSRYYVPATPWTTKISFEYNNSTNWHFLKVGEVENTSKNVKYVSLKDSEYWNKSEEIGTIRDIFVIPKALDPYKANQVKVTLYDCYGNVQNVTDYKVNVHNEDLTKFVNPFAYLFLSLILILLSGIYIIFKGVFFKW